MSYTLLLLRVPPGSTEDDVERIANATIAAEDTRAPAPPHPENERRKRRLVDALLAECSELKGGEPDYAELARAEDVSEQQARERFHWWTVTAPEEGAGIEITLYDDYVSIDLPWAAGTDEDWDDISQYLQILVREGGFVVWDPQGPDLVDLTAEPFGGVRRKERPSEAGPNRRRRKARARRAAETGEGSDEQDVEPEDIRRGGDIAKLINRISDEAIAEPLAAAGFKRFGRTWRRILDNGLVHVVNVHWRPIDGGVEGEFSLSAGVYSRELAESIALYKPTASPKEHDCQVRLRPGPHGRNCWRVRVPGLATPDPDLPGLVGRFFTWLDHRADTRAPARHARATRELREALERHAFPALERLSTLRELRDHLARSPDLFWAAHASVLLGESEEAKRLVDRALDKAGSNPEFSKIVREWADRQGLSS
jgi:hypothetical protein